MANNIELEIVVEDPKQGVSEEYLKINPLGKIPSFVGADGFVLTESIAIAIYSMYPTTLPGSYSRYAMMKDICQQFIPVLILRVE